jgi:hypothetical protein
MHVVNMGLVFVSIRCTEDIICGNNDRFWKKLHWFKFQVTNNILVSWALYRQQWRWDKNIPTCWESLHFISLTSVPSSIRRLAKPHITWLGARLSSSEQNIRTGPNPADEYSVCQYSARWDSILLGKRVSMPDARAFAIQECNIDDWDESPTAGFWRNWVPTSLVKSTGLES